MTQRQVSAWLLVLLAFSFAGRAAQARSNVPDKAASNPPGNASGSAATPVQVQVQSQAPARAETEAAAAAETKAAAEMKTSADAGEQDRARPILPLYPAHGERALPPERVRITEQGEHVVSGVRAPSLAPFLPAAGSATGAAVIIAPGGGHSELWVDHEGYNVARWLAAHGVAAFVLKYRLAREPGSSYTIEGTELADMQRALRLVRSRAAQYGIDPERIGVMGFSAGGELAALASTRFATNAAAPADTLPATPAAPDRHTDAIDTLSARPAFQALLYPAIPKQMPLTAQTPPAFLVCGEKDRQDIAEGLPMLYLAMHRAGVSAELHVFAATGHGFGLRATNPPATNPSAVALWPTLFLDWLAAQGMLHPATRP